MTAKLKGVAASAVEYAREGRRVFPLYEVLSSGGCACRKGGDCTTPGKHPRIAIPKGAKDHPATSDVNQVEKWWKKWPQANIGFWLEGSGLVVLDIDKSDKKDGFSGLRDIMAFENVSEIPKTLTCDTPSGGVHHYFQFCEGIPNRANALGPGLDTWHSQHYVILPPSNHLKGIYQWRPGITATAPFPEWLRPKTERKSANAKAPGRPPKEKFNPSNPEDIERLKHALAFVDATDRETWVLVGFALARAFGWSDEGFAVYDRWASMAHNYDANKTHEQYYRQSKHVPPSPITTASIFQWASKNPSYRPLVAVRDLDHYKLAEAVIEAIETESGERPVYANGAIWSVENAIWRKRTIEELGMTIARKYSGGRYCKRASDFRSIAQVVSQLIEDNTFFENAAIGIAGPSGFWRLGDLGNIIHGPLKPSHRQRLRVQSDPDPNKKPIRLLKLLADAFSGHEPEQQTRLVQELMGCTIARSLWQYRIVGLFLGVSGAGKSTLLKFLSSLFMPEQVTACSPQRWGDEYYAAGLADSALNIVGDLDKKEAIPAAFKSVTGRDLVQGRHPTHRPMTFICTASHFFNSNSLPPSNDHSDAFFNRWRIVEFPNSVPPQNRDIDLDQKLIAESGAALHWMLEGAAMVIKNGGIIETQTHRRLIDKWRLGNNSALLFIRDMQANSRNDPQAEISGQILFNRYRAWAVEAGFRPFGRTGFYEALIDGGVEVIERGHQIFVRGIS